MARTVNQIQQEIIAYKNAQPELAAFNSTSHRAIWLLWTYVIAVAIAVHEQLLDLYTASLETLLAQLPAATKQWVQKKMFEFQYSTTDPQVIQLIDTIPQYPVINETLQIITGCSVNSTFPNVVDIKVAKGDPYVALTLAEKTAAQDYINTIGIAGVQYNVISLNADTLFVTADIYYQGQYTAVIQDNVFNSVNNYLVNLSKTNFDGILKVSDLETAFRTATGVTDVFLRIVAAQPSGGLSVPLVFNFPGLTYQYTYTREYTTAAGYIVPSANFLSTSNFYPV
jgi:hypothetical protein